MENLGENMEKEEIECLINEIDIAYGWESPEPMQRQASRMLQSQAVVRVERES